MHIRPYVRNTDIYYDDVVDGKTRVYIYIDPQRYMVLCTIPYVSRLILFIEERKKDRQIIPSHER
jgi:hypothetical protein